MEKINHIAHFIKKSRTIRPSLSRDYLIIVGLIAAGVILLSAFFSWTIYQSHVQQTNQQLIRAGNRVERSLAESFDYVTRLMDYFGKEINKLETEDPIIITQLLRGHLTNDPVVKSLFSWTLFDWLNAKNILLVNSTLGKSDTQKDLSFRSYTKKNPSTPWKLHFAEPDIGIPSGQWVIPAALGITDKKGKYIGAIGMGFSIANLYRKIEQDIGEQSVSYVVLSEERNIVFTSADNTLERKSDYFRKALSNQHFTQKETNFLPIAVTYGNITYTYYKTIAGTPFIVLLGYDNAIRDHAIKNILLPRIVGFVVLGTIFVFILLVLRRTLITPIVQLSGAAEKIRQTKDTEKLDIPHPKTRELHILARQLIHLSYYIRKLRRTQGQLRIAKDDAEKAHLEVKQINESLENRVQERTAALEEALAGKSEFLKNMSHEVRSPIQGILAFSQTLAKDWYKLPEDIRYERAVHIGHNSNRLLSLVTNLLDLSQLEKGKMSFNMTMQNNLAVVIEEVIKESQPFLEEKKLDINFLPPACETITTFDTTRITQVVRNLLINAIKFTEKGKITISVTRLIAATKNGIVSPCLELSIQDEGIGIPENEFRTIFDQFIQSSRTKTRAGGTGLGLSIAKQIIEAHNGIIWAKNNKDKGATFTFRLPITEEKSEAGDVTDRLQQHEVEINNAHIVAIDDEKNCLSAITMYLEMDGHKVTTAVGGIEGLETIKEHHETIDLILLDLMMPDLYGLDLLNELKNIEHARHIPVVLQTGTCDHEEVERGLKLGAVDILPKPYDRATLKALVVKVLQQKVHSLVD